MIRDTLRGIQQSRLSLSNAT